MQYYVPGTHVRVIAFEQLMSSLLWLIYRKQLQGLVTRLFDKQQRAHDGAFLAALLASGNQ